MNMLKQQILTVSLALSLFSCRHQNDDKSVLRIDAEQLQGYWAPQIYLDKDLQDPFLYIHDNKIEMASQSNPDVHCPDERSFSIEQNNQLKIEKSASCEELRLEFTAINNDSFDISVKGKAIHFLKVKPSRVYLILNNMFAKADDLSPSLRTFMAEAPDPEMVDHHIAQLREQLPQLQLHIADAAAFQNIQLLSEGRILKAGEVESPSATAYFVLAGTQATQGGSDKPIEQVRLAIPRLEKNLWTYVVNPDLKPLQNAGLTDEEIQDLLKRQRPGIFSSGKWRLNSIDLENADFKITCHGPFKDGLLTLASVQNALGSFVDLKKL